MKTFPILFVLLIILVAVQAYTISLLTENLEVADLIIVSTEHQRNEARERVKVLERAIIQQNEQCTQPEPRMWREPYYPEQQPQQNQEDTPPVSC